MQFMFLIFLFCGLTVNQFPDGILALKANSNFGCDFAR